MPNDDFSRDVSINTHNTNPATVASVTHETPLHDITLASVNIADNFNTNTPIDLSVVDRSTPAEKSSTPLSASSSSSGKSVEEILNSIVRFKEKKTTSDKENTARKQLNLGLPSVMTTQQWIDLSKALQDEKDEAEKQKNDRKKIREMKQKELKEKKDKISKKREEKKKLKELESNKKVIGTT